MRSYFVAAPALAMLVAACGSDTTAPAGGQQNPPPPPAPGVVTVQIISSSSDTLTSLRDTLTVSARVLVDGQPDTTRVISWSSSGSTILRSVGSGRFEALNNGTVTLRASSGGASDSVSATVFQRAATVNVGATSDTVFATGIRTRFSVEARDARGWLIPASHASPSWSSDDTAVLLPEGLGLARVIAAGTASLSATLDGVSGQAAVTVVSEIGLTIDTTLAESLQWLVEDSLQANPAIPGIQAAVLFADGSMWTGVAGIDDSSSRMRLNRIMPLGSTGKMLPSALALQLVDQGLLTLEDTVGQWLPATTNLPPDVTVRQMLNNSSGIFNYGAHPNIGASLLADLNKSWQPQEILDSFLLAPLFPPGQMYTSSNTNFLVLAMIGELATGGNFAAELRSRFWTPLGLTTGYESRDEAPPGPLAAAWWPGLSGLEDFNQTLLGPAIHSTRWGGGSIWMTAPDLVRWGRAYFDGTLFSAPLMTEILTAIPDNSGFIPGQIGAGLGVRRYNYLGREQWGHSGATSGANSLLVWDRASGIVVAVQINASGPIHGSAHFRIVPALLQRALQG